MGLVVYGGERSVFLKLRKLPPNNIVISLSKVFHKVCVHHLPLQKILLNHIKVGFLEIQYDWGGCGRGGSP